MNDLERGAQCTTTSTRRRFAGILVLINLGVLLSLLFGPNLGHANPIVSYGALGTVLLGLLFMLRIAVIERRRKSPPHPKAL